MAAGRIKCDFPMSNDYSTVTVTKKKGGSSLRSEKYTAPPLSARIGLTKGNPCHTRRRAAFSVRGWRTAHSALGIGGKPRVRPSLGSPAWGIEDRRRLGSSATPARLASSRVPGAVSTAAPPPPLPVGPATSVATLCALVSPGYCSRRGVNNPV